MTVPVRRLVPYVTAYEGEALAYQLIVDPHVEATDGIRLSYADPVGTDWLYGVLWYRQGITQTGRPLWKLVNTPRQRRCMMHMLCQVCGRPAADNDGWIWWLMPEPPGTTGGGLPFTHVPPCCRACIPAARALCPRLRHEAHVYTALAAEPFGVVADLYRPAAGRKVVLVQHAVEVPLDAFRRLDFALATQLLVSLDGLQKAEDGPAS
ncbi:hypothetical protein [Nonomuraea sp. GTA35]|uniref:hypothetical protein n=1 Tax=Nonomuraea sp. GTA35 TaxID=1676746 RepID=UPI0035BF55C4